MTFLTPAIAAIAAAIAIPALVILYFLKLKRRDVEVSTTLLWKKAIEDLQANAPFQKLRNNILLILQLLALLAALFALAQPELSRGIGAGSKHVIVIDRSASMKATDGDPDKADAGVTRLQQAKLEASRFVDSLREPGLFGAAGDEAMIVAFDTIADRVQNFTTSKAELKRAINAITATDSPTAFSPAFDTARAFSKPVLQAEVGLVNTGSTATIHLFSDGRLPDLESLRPTADDRLVYYPIGRTDSTNLGIVGLRAERAFDEPAKLSIFVSIQNSAKEPRRTDVQLAVDGQVVGIREVTIPAARVESVEQGQPAAAAVTPAPAAPQPPSPAAKAQALPGVSGVVFSLERPQGGVFAIQLRPAASGPPDPLATDNFGYLVVPPAKRLAVALVTSGNLFLRGALEALPLAKLDVFTPAQGASLFDDSGKPVQNYDVYVLDGWLPTVPSAQTAGKPTLPPAPGLPQAKVLAFNVNPPPPLGLISVGPGEPTVVLKHDRDHPSLRNIAIDSLTISVSRKLSVPPRSGVRVLAEGVSGPLIYEATDLGTRALVATFDLLNSNWPLDAGFVLFMAQGTAYLGQDSADAGALQIKPGQTIEQALPGTASGPRITLPDGARADLLLSPEGRVVFGPADSVGIYTLSWIGPPGAADSIADGRSRRAFASNLLSGPESDLATAPPAALQSLLRNVSAGERPQSPTRLWPWLLLAALAVLLVEWFVYNRKVTL